MSRIRLWSLVALLAAFCVYFVPGGPARPTSVSAEDCTLGNTGTLVIRIVDVSTGDLLDIGGTEVLVDPDPTDFVLDSIVVDSDVQDASTSLDQDSDAGIIRIEDACSTEGAEEYEFSVWSLPGILEDCVFGSDKATELDADDTEQVTLEVDCTGVGPTPTVTVTPTSGPAATVKASTSPLAVSCNGTSVISVEVRDAAGNPVKTGTAVTIATTLGSVSPNSGFVTGSNGSVFAFFTAPSASGGTATITATAGSASGTASVSVTCGTTTSTTVPPPPTVSTGGSGGGGVITPPNTGDGGLVAGAGQSAAGVVFAGFVALLALGGVAFMQVRRI